MLLIHPLYFYKIWWLQDTRLFFSHAFLAYLTTRINPRREEMGYFIILSYIWIFNDLKKIRKKKFPWPNFRYYWTGCVIQLANWECMAKVVYSYTNGILVEKYWWMNPPPISYISIFSNLNLTKAEPSIQMATRNWESCNS